MIHIFPSISWKLFITNLFYLINFIAISMRTSLSLSNFHCSESTSKFEFSSMIANNVTLKFIEGVQKKVNLKRQETVNVVEIINFPLIQTIPEEYVNK